jgi:hypothetical protein
VTVVLIPPRQRDQRRSQQTGDHIDVEDPAPGKLVDEETAQQRSDNGRNTPDAREKSLHPGALFEAEHLTDQDKGQGQDTARSQTLQSARRDQLRHVLGKPTQDRTDQEECHRSDIQFAAAINIREFAIQRNGSGGGQHVGREDPRVMFQPAQLPNDGRHGRGNDRGFHRSKKQAEHDPSRNKNNAIT